MTIMIYITTSSEVEAKKIARAVVREKLAACANIIPGMKSVYRWKGRVESAAECVLVFKTRKTLFKKLEKRVKALHSYDTPCIVALPVVAGYGPYLQWIKDEVK